MKKTFLILLFLSFQILVFSKQQGFTLQGIILDSLANTPVSNASITLSGTNVAAKSNEMGYFSIWVANTPSFLNISHLSYQNKTIQIDSASPEFIHIFLREKITSFPLLTVTANKPEILAKDQPLYMIDYGFMNEKIIALAYKDKMFSQACLCLMNTDGDTLCSVRIRNIESLFKDCFGNNHLITKSTVWQLFNDSNIVNFLYPVDIEKFEEVLKPVIAALNNKFYYLQYYYNNQLLQYYYYDKKAGKTKELKVIADESKLFMLRDRERIISGSDDPEIQARFEDLAFYKPVFAPLVKIHDTICIFNYADSVIAFYSDSCTLLKEIPISFHNNRYWKREIYVDDATGKVYSLFGKEGISTLKEINLTTGKLQHPIVIPEFPFIEKIKVYNGNIYFLYTKQNTQTEYKRLYRMKI